MKKHIKQLIKDWKYDETKARHKRSSTLNRYNINFRLNDDYAQ